MEKQFDLFEELAERFKPADSLNVFFNTIPESGDTLKQLRSRAGTQNAKILDFFQRHPLQNYTPSELHYQMGLTLVPLTSVRRSITTLTSLGFLRMTDIRREGRYGVKNRTWTLNNLNPNYDTNKTIGDAN